MGQEIVYCSVCQIRLLGSDFEKGKAFKGNLQAFCQKCAPEDVKANAASTHRSAPPSRSSPPPHKSTRAIPILGGGSPSTTRRMVRSTRKSLALPLVAGIGGVVGVILVLVVALGGGAREEREEPVPAAPLATAPPAAVPLAVDDTAAPPDRPAQKDPASVPRPSDAQEMLDFARGFRTSSPDNWVGLIRAYERAVKTAEGTPLEKEARHELAKAREEESKVRLETLRMLDGKLASHSKAETFGPAMKTLSVFRSRWPDKKWTEELDRRKVDLQKKIDQAYATAEKDAVAARRKGDQEKVAGVEKRVSSWGIATLKETLKNVLAKMKREPTAKERYHARWQEAMDRAVEEDLEDALSILEKAVPEAGAAREEAASDLKLVKDALSLRDETRRDIGKWASGRKVKFSFIAEDGGSKTAKGTVNEVRDGLVTLRELDRVVALGEIHIESVLDASTPDPAAAFLRALSGTPGKSLPGKYSELAKKQKNRKQKKSEQAARQLYYAALREMRATDTAFEGVKKALALLSDHESTAFVRRNGKAIKAIRKRGREYILFADWMKGSPDFAQGRVGEIPLGWTLLKDTAQGSVKKQFVEFAWSALPETTYRIWIHAGACCGETLEARALLSGSKETVRLRPGFQMTPRTHGDHQDGGAEVKWRWISIPLPKTIEPGPKTLRILAARKGFSLACAILSSVRRAPPRASEFRKLIEAKFGALAKESAGRVSVPGLAAHWKLNEGAGNVARDATIAKLHGVVSGGIWVPNARNGKPALRFDGKDDRIDLGPNRLLLKQVKGCSVAAWINLDRNDIKTILLAFSIYNGGKATANSRYWLEIDQGKPKVGGRSIDTEGAQSLTATEHRLESKKWYHVTGVVDYENGKVILYVNGKEIARKAVPFAKKATEDSPSLCASIASQDDGKKDFFSGMLSDIKVYTRVLSVEEVSRLAGRVVTPSKR